MALRFLIAGKDADGLASKFLRCLNPVFYKLHALTALIGISMREIIADTRSADFQSEAESFAFYFVKHFIGWNIRIAGNIIGGNVHGHQAFFSTEFHHLIDANTTIEKLFVKRISVETKFESAFLIRHHLRLALSCLDRGRENSRG